MVGAVPLMVMVEFLVVSVPPASMVKIPVPKFQFEPLTVSSVELAEPEPEMFVVPETEVWPLRLVVKRKAPDGLMVKLPVMVGVAPKV